MTDRMDVFVARQPIFDRVGKPVAYELLFRSDRLRNEFNGSEAGLASTQVVANALLSIGWEKILGGKPAFINFDRSSLLDGLHSALPRESVVLEILESVLPDEELVAACQEIHRQGYTIALDDFVDDPSFQPLLQMAKLIKVDIRITSQQEQERLLRTYQPRGFSLLAEKVETHEEFHWARNAGYDFFQGYFFARPILVPGKQIPASEITCLNLLAEMQHGDLDFERLQALISKDVSLAYKLLRYANSPLFYSHAAIRSVRQALVTLGEANIRHWVALAALPAMAAGKPSELITHSLVRARFCESIAQAAGISEYELGFLMGLLSLLDALVDMPLEEALHLVGVGPDITRPLLGVAPEQDAFGQVYELVCRYEVGEWTRVEALASRLNIESSAVSQAYAEATVWAEQALKAGVRTSESQNRLHPSPNRT